MRRHLHVLARVAALKLGVAGAGGAQASPAARGRPTAELFATDNTALITDPADSRLDTRLTRFVHEVREIIHANGARPGSSTLLDGVFWSGDLKKAAYERSREFDVDQVGRDGLHHIADVLAKQYHQESVLTFRCLPHTSPDTDAVEIQAPSVSRTRLHLEHGRGALRGRGVRELKPCLRPAERHARRGPAGRCVMATKVAMAARLPHARPGQSAQSGSVGAATTALMSLSADHPADRAATKAGQRCRTPLTTSSRRACTRPTNITTTTMSPQPSAAAPAPAATTKTQTRARGRTGAASREACRGSQKNRRTLSVKPCLCSPPSDVTSPPDW
ncbi:hypothetical protein ACFXKI_34995 [Streptomyces mirabilis]|uniref:hypothetical protein n=1 Tax=Streptomyces mirabilis TaxID=68239 RepID=UPI00367AFCAB